MKFFFRVFNWRLYIQGQRRKHLKAFAVSKGLVTVLLLSDREEGEEGDRNLSEIKFFDIFPITLQVI